MRQDIHNVTCSMMDGKTSEIVDCLKGQTRILS